MASEKQDIKKCELHYLSFQGGHEKVDENWRGHVAWTVLFLFFFVCCMPMIFPGLTGFFCSTISSFKKLERAHLVKALGNNILEPSAYFEIRQAGRLR